MAHVSDAPDTDTATVDGVIAEFQALARTLADATADHVEVRARFRRRISALCAERGVDVVWQALAVVSGAWPTESPRRPMDR